MAHKRRGRLEIIEDEQNKGRTARRGADDTSVLQEEGRQQGIVSFMRGAATVCYRETGTLQVRRGEVDLQEVPHPLLSPSDERTNARSDALGWSENDLVPPDCRHQAYHKRIVTTGKGV